MCELAVVVLDDSKSMATVSLSRASLRCFSLASSRCFASARASETLDVMTGALGLWP